MEIVRDVLEILRVRDGLNKTEIVYGANLNYKRASCIINWLIEHKLVTEVSGKYEITEKGETFPAAALPDHRDIHC